MDNILNTLIVQFSACFVCIVQGFNLMSYYGKSFTENWSTWGIFFLKILFLPNILWIIKLFEFLMLIWKVKELSRKTSACCSHYSLSSCNALSSASFPTSSFRACAVKEATKDVRWQRLVSKRWSTINDGQGSSKKLTRARRSRRRTWRPDSQ